MTMFLLTRCGSTSSSIVPWSTMARTCSTGSNRRLSSCTPWVMTMTMAISAHCRRARTITAQASSWRPTAKGVVSTARPPRPTCYTSTLPTTLSTPGMAHHLMRSPVEAMCHIPKTRPQSMSPQAGISTPHRESVRSRQRSTFLLQLAARQIRQSSSKATT